VEAALDDMISGTISRNDDRARMNFKISGEKSHYSEKAEHYHKNNMERVANVYSCVFDLLNGEIQVLTDIS
jgi:hypothetical protein